jgi:tetratricopeptide (TPR) repeat protein
VAESPHNEYLRLFSELGIIGGFFFLGAIVFFYLKWVDKKDQSFIHAGILGGTVIFFVHAMVDSNFHEPGLVIITIILSTFLLDKKLFQFTLFAKSNEVKKMIFYPVLAISFILWSFIIIKPAIGWYFYAKGYDQMKNHEDNAALPNFKNAIFWESQNARYHNVLANAYFNIFQKTNYYGWVFKALEELNKALRFNPMDGNYFKLKADIYQALAVREGTPPHIQELLADAFTNYKEALKLLPYDVSLYVTVGSVEEASGKPEEAEKHYNQAILIEPYYLLAREKKIELLLKKGQKEAALKNYQELFSVYDRIQKLATSDAEKAFIYFNQEKLEKIVEEAK